MTNGKPPFDPEPDPERTVIKPNPGGRRDAPVIPSPVSMPTVAPAQSAVQDIWGGARQSPGNASPNQQSQGTLAPPASKQPPLAPAMDLSAMGASGKTGGPNPVLEAAMPLLLLLANVRIAKSIPQVAPMMSTVAQGIENFETTLRSQNLPEAQVRTAKYTICATADDIVQNLPSSDRLLWTQYSMLSRYFQVRDSGVGFFDELAKLRQNPQINQHLLGLMHACMSLGFEGKYRAIGGDVAHQQIRRDVYQMLRSLEARVTDELSPHWRGLSIAAEHVRRAVPLWAVASGAAGLLLLTFMSFRWLLGGMSEAAELKLAALHPGAEIAIFRPEPVPPPPDPPPPPPDSQLERIRARLSSEIADGKVAADYAGKDIVVRLLNDAVFDKGSASVREGFAASVARIAVALDKEKGQIHIVGHTDSTPIRSSLRFKDNQDLSEQRARAVALMLVSGISDPLRLSTQGMADKAPIDTADTPEAKAKNRRVEVFIPREETLSAGTNPEGSSQP
jgi:type VI secretion system protein ImpK